MSNIPSDRYNANNNTRGDLKSNPALSRNALPFFDEAEVMKALAVMVEPESVFEIRILNPRRSGRGFVPRVFFGYFDDPTKVPGALKALRLDGAKGVYVTLNPVNPPLLARSYNKFTEAKDEKITADKHILCRRWLLVDCDPKRPEGISASDEEKAHAHERALTIYAFLKEAGWPEPVATDSGNGFHLLYRVDLPVDSETVTQCLTALDQRFSDEVVGVDTTVSNPSRIGKLYGTLAGKGDNCPELGRPHRLSKLLKVPNKVEPVPAELLDALAAQVQVQVPPAARPETPPPKRVSLNTHTQSWDRTRVQEFIDTHLADCRPDSAVPYAGGFKWVLGVCPFNPEHTDRSAVIVIKADGTLGFRCQHDGCKRNNWKALRAKFEPRSESPHRDALPKMGSSECPSLPEITLAGGPNRIVDCARQLGELLNHAGGVYNFGEGPARLVLSKSKGGSTTARVQMINNERAPSLFETVATIRCWDPKKKEEVAGICNRAMAGLIINAPEFFSELPPLSIILPCPLLTVNETGGLSQVAGYSSELKAYCLGEPIPECTLIEAIARLDELMADFLFATPGDRARALAAVLTPAMTLGGLLNSRPPFTVIEADKSQAGKGTLVKIDTAIYMSKPTPITMRKGGVGSFDESFDAALATGNPFIFVDNVRNAIDSQKLESFATEDSHGIRLPYEGTRYVDASKYFVFITSNRPEGTPDLANRSSVIKIKKREKRYEFRAYPEGNILDHVEACPGYYLAAVFAVIKEWWRQGRPETKTSEHDFKKWARPLDWIVCNILNAGPLLGGHRAAQLSMSEPDIRWLQDVALAILGNCPAVAGLKAGDVAWRLSQVGFKDIPGLKSDDSLADRTVRDLVNREMGKRLGRCFGEEEEIDLGDIVIRRTEQNEAKPDGLGTWSTKRYHFERIDGLGVCTDRGAAMPDPLPATAKEAAPVTIIEPPLTAKTAIGGAGVGVVDYEEECVNSPNGWSPLYNGSMSVMAVDDECMPLSMVVTEERIEPITLEDTDADPAGSELKPDPQSTRLIPIALIVLDTIDSLGLSLPRAQRAKELAADVIHEPSTGKKIQAADELGAILKGGKTRSKALAAAIVDVLQLKLLFDAGDATMVAGGEWPEGGGAQSGSQRT